MSVYVRVCVYLSVCLSLSWVAYLSVCHIRFLFLMCFVGLWSLINQKQAEPSENLNKIGIDIS